MEGQNVTIEYRWADGQNDRLPGLAADLVARQAAVIVGHSAAARAAKAASTTTQVIFVVGADPIRTGLVANSIGRRQHDGGDLHHGRCHLEATQPMHDLAPKAESIGAPLDPNDMEAESSCGKPRPPPPPSAEASWGEGRDPGEFNAAFASIVQAGVGALLVGGGPFFTSQRQRLALLSARHAIPTSYTEREFALAGGLMSYGPSSGRCISPRW